MWALQMTSVPCIAPIGTTTEEMHKPKTYDSNGEPCIMVLKLGITTDVTVGRASNIFSFSRYYDDQGVVGDPVIR